MRKLLNKLFVKFGLLMIKAPTVLADKSNSLNRGELSSGSRRCCRRDERQLPGRQYLQRRFLRFDRRARQEETEYSAVRTALSRNLVKIGLYALFDAAKFDIAA